MQVYLIIYLKNTARDIDIWKIIEGTLGLELSSILTACARATGVGVDPRRDAYPNV